MAPARNDSQAKRSDSGGEPQHQSRSGMVRGRLVDLPRTTQLNFGDEGDMVELVDTLASGASGSDTVRVRVSLSPPMNEKHRALVCGAGRTAQVEAFART